MNGHLVASSDRRELGSLLLLGNVPVSNVAGRHMPYDKKDQAADDDQNEPVRSFGFSLELT
jgi:hypothetical protein